MYSSKLLPPLLVCLFAIIGCGGSSNSTQPNPVTTVIDTDLDGVANNVDPDDDNDGVIDENDAFPLDSTESVDSDLDGIGNNADPDDDNDGVLDENDAFPLDPTESTDTDLDGIGNNTDFYPEDKQCYRESDGNGSQCYLTWMSSQSKQVQSVQVIDNGRIVYHVKRDDGLSDILIQRLENLQFESHISDLEINAVHYQTAHQRLYTGDDLGRVRYFDEHYQLVDFAQLNRPLSGFESAGDFLLSRVGVDKYVTITVKVLNSEGELKGGGDLSTINSNVFDPVNGIRYSVRFRANLYSENALYCERLTFETTVIDQITGEIADRDYFNFECESIVLSPKRLFSTADNKKLITDSGHFFRVNENTVNLEGKRYTPFNLAHWSVDNELITLAQNSESIQTEIAFFRADSFNKDIELTQVGQPLAFIPYAGDVYVLTQDTSALTIKLYEVTDSDQDGLPGWWESYYGLDDTNASDADLDADNDGLSNQTEFTLLTKPNSNDSDNDGLSDFQEVNETKTDPINADSDNDGLSDGEEIYTHLTDPLNMDSDSDGVSDGEEINTYHSNPLLSDTDGDGMDDFFEVTYQLNPLENDTQLDFDNDLLINIYEFNLKTNPALADSDYDGLGDGDEVWHVKSDPTNRDSDKDRMEDGFEVKYGLNPLSDSDAGLDPDNDNLTNMEEFFIGTDPINTHDYITSVQWVNKAATVSGSNFVLHKQSQLPIEKLWEEKFPDKYPGSGLRIFPLKDKLVVLQGELYGDMYSVQASAYDVYTSEEIWTTYFQPSTEGISRAIFNTSDALNYVATDVKKIYSLNTETGEHISNRLVEFNEKLSYKDITPFDGNYYSIGHLPENFNQSIEPVTGLFALSEEGEMLFYTQFSSGNYSDHSQLSVNEDYLFACMEGSSYLINRHTGDVIYKVVEADLLDCSYSVLDKHSLIMSTDTQIISLDLHNKSRIWSIDTLQSTKLTVALGVVYFTQNKQLYAADLETGEILWVFNTPDELLHYTIVTLDKVIVAGNGGLTYVIDIDTQNYTTLDSSGKIVFTDGVLLISDDSIGPYATISAYSFQQDDDEDGLPNYWEKRYNFSPRDPQTVLMDSDNDGLYNLAEFQAKTNPLKADTDSDGITDFTEVMTYKTNPSLSDTDNDGLNDQDELQLYFTSPLQPDTDKDSLSDGDEVKRYQSDPLDANAEWTPIMNFYESFQESTLPIGFSEPDTSDVSWTVSTPDPLYNNLSLISGLISPGMQSEIAYSGWFAAGTMSFYADFTNTNCDSFGVRWDCYDGITLLLNDEELEIIRFTTHVSVEIPAGYNEIVWRFERDVYGSYASALYYDYVFIDNISFTAH